MLYGAFVRRFDSFLAPLLFAPIQNRFCRPIYIARHRLWRGSARRRLTRPKYRARIARAGGRHIFFRRKSRITIRLVSDWKINDLAGIVTDPRTGVTANGEMMRYTLLVCPISCLLGGVCLWLGSRILDKKGE